MWYIYASFKKFRRYMSRMFLSPDAIFGKEFAALASAGLLTKRQPPPTGDAIERNKAKQKAWRDRRKAENLAQRALIEEKRNSGLA